MHDDHQQANSEPKTDKKSISALSPADIEWIEGKPLSKNFKDFYYSLTDSVAESDYIFLQGNQLKQRWIEMASANPSHAPEPNNFTLAETGFGAGLNFVMTVSLWMSLCRDYPLLKTKHLHFISYEKHPLNSEQLARISSAQLDQHQDFNNFSQELVKAYPQLTPGFHRLDFFNHTIHLTLCFGDARKLLPLTQAKVDAWFLDGFSPAKNPELWHHSVFRSMVKLSKPSSTFSTYTAASDVRKGLESAGFQVSKAPGYGKKREMLFGELSDVKEIPVTDSNRKTPWFSLHSLDTENKANSKPAIQSSLVKSNLSKSCLVIGGGLAGSACAFAMASRGWQVEVMEREMHIAAAASGNPSGVLFTKLSAHDNAINRFNQFSYLHALKHLKLLAASDHNKKQSLRWNRCGVLQLGFDIDEIERQLKAKNSQLWPDSIARLVSAATASKISGVALQNGGLYFPDAGWVDPRSLCQARINHPNIHLSLNQAAIELIQLDNTQWQVVTDSSSTTVDAAIIANARDALAFSQTQHLPLRNLRGQISYLPSTEASESLKTILCYQGYTTPAIDQQHCVGASFHPNDEKIDLRHSDHESNLKLLKAVAPEFHQQLQPFNIEQLHGRAQLRCQTPDYLPVVGPVADRDFYLDAYKRLRTGQIHKPFPQAQYHKNLYISVGHGSRGLTSSALSADIIAAGLCDEPQAIDKEVLHALHPGRFIIRDLKRRLA